MGRLASTYQRAVDAHRRALARVAAARTALTASGAPPADPDQLRDTAARLRRAAEELAPGWLGADLGFAGAMPTFDHPAPPHAVQRVRVGLGYPTADLPFPALVPLLGGNHLAIDADARDPRVAALLRTLVVRLLAANPAGTIRVRTLDQAALGATFLPLRPLVEAGVLADPATGEDGVRELLADAEEHVRATQLGTGDGTSLLVVTASLPAYRPELVRLAALTHAGAGARVCVIAAGYPPPAHGIQAPAFGTTTQIRLDRLGAHLGDPPGEPFSLDGQGLAVPVTLDRDPPLRTLAAVAAHLGERVRRDSALLFTDLIPPWRWSESSIDGLRTTIGRTRRTPVELAFDDATPHWLVGGRTGAGKTVFLLDVLYGLAARYSPDELAFYLLDFKEGISFTEFVPTGRDPTWIPHARAVGIESDREYGVAVLRELRREMNRRANDLKRYGVTKLSDLRRGQADIAMPRIVVVIDEFHVLFAGNDALAREATALLEELARKGRSYGIHLVLASQTVSGVEALYGKSESIFGQFPLRIALPGGNGVLDVLNDAAAALPLG
ncbi:MAG TPA: FtsK/SpoIIIE domain-containing protein, partial [Micromonosporaceae bacterium]|nr:FtsK/SpoIIIE domain-containing protein [Micromonosporaceae bacterium]